MYTPFHSRLSRAGVLGVWAILLSPLACSTTLEQLSLDEMAQRSTGIVRAKVVAASTVSRGADIYTRYQLAVSETWKGRTVLEVSVPGGVARGVRQTVAGAPYLNTGEEYLLFLWTGKSGMTQVIGMSQGVFQVKVDASGTPIVVRAASAETMVDDSGRKVEDRGLSLRLSEMRSRVGGAQRSPEAEQ